MSKTILKAVSHIIICVMVIEIAFVHINSDVFSQESISIEDMSLMKEKALDWLEENQNNDGSWGDVLSIYTTTQVLDNIAYQEGLVSARVKALDWLNETDFNSNDDFFRAYLSKVKENEYLTYKLENIDLGELQNTDGGFGLTKGYQSDVLDTAMALECMSESDNVNNSEIRKVMNYLAACQNEDGGFSYSENESNTYLTAYVYKCAKEYLNESISSTTKNMVQQSKAYLLEKENDNLFWGLEEDTIRNSLMSSIALVENDEETLNRIAAISNKLGEDGSLYGDAVLTSLYISLINEYEIVTGKSTLNHVKIKSITVNADKERIGAYTELTFKPVIIGQDDSMKVIAAVSDDNDYSETLTGTNENIFVWNTENNIGKYDVFIAVIDKNTGSVITSKTKNFEILESLDAASFTSNVTPKAYKIDSGKNIKINMSALILTNADKELTADVNIRDEEGELLFSDSKNIFADKDKKEVYFDEVIYKPTLEKSTLLSVTTSIKVNGVTLKTKTNYIKAYLSEDENRIDVDYNVSSNYIYSPTDKLDVDFSLSGKGLSENIKRRPMDIMLILDNSGSMNREDWLKAIEGAKIIINYMQPQDRAAIRYINYTNVSVKFSGDKEYLIKQLDMRKNEALYWGTPVYKSLNLSVNDFKEEDRDKAIYIFTDGVRDGDVSTLNEKELIDNGITVYSVFMECNASPIEAEQATETMNYIADITGGKSLNVPTNDEIADCVTKLLGDIFKMAGKDVKLSMTLGKDVPFEDISFNITPDIVTTNDDGTTTISYDINYLRVGEDFNTKIQYNLLNMTAEEKINLIKDIKLTYTDNNDEIIDIDLDDIIIDIVSNISHVTPEEELEELEVGNDKTVVMTEQNNSNILSHNKPEVTEKENKDLISGSVSIPNNVVFAGEDLIAEVELAAASGMSVEQINTRIVLVSKNDENIINTVDKIIEISNQNNIKEQIEIETKNLYEGEYIAILMAEVNGEMTPLDAVGVTLNEHSYELTVTAGFGGCVNEVSGEYKRGEIVTVKASANDGFVFDRWESEDIELENNQINMSEIKIVMPAEKVSIKAVFAKKKDTIVSNEGRDNNKEIQTVPNKNGNKEKSKVTDNKKNLIKGKEGSNKPLISPLTGDFVTRDKIKIMLLLQSISLIIICTALKKKEQEEKEV